MTSIIWDTDAIGERLAQLRGEAPSGRVFAKDHWTGKHVELVAVDVQVSYVDFNIPCSNRPLNWRMQQHKAAEKKKEKPKRPVKELLKGLLDNMMKTKVDAGMNEAINDVILNAGTGGLFIYGGGSQYTAESVKYDPGTDRVIKAPVYSMSQEELERAWSNAFASQGPLTFVGIDIAKNETEASAAVVLSRGDAGDYLVEAVATIKKDGREGATPLPTLYPPNVERMQAALLKEAEERASLGYIAEANRLLERHDKIKGPYMEGYLKELDRIGRQDRLSAEDYAKRNHFTPLLSIKKQYDAMCRDEQEHDRAKRSHLREVELQQREDARRQAARLMSPRLTND